MIYTKEQIICDKNELKQYLTSLVRGELQDATYCTKDGEIHYKAYPTVKERIKAVETLDKFYEEKDISDYPIIIGGEDYIDE